ncbi:hypothetical protein Bca52824_068336 [Brassica carinata]|uniref:UDP-glucose 6-dehydrogenase n=1 Tax=Brassica carinata TaxID=52824 RepID=A0A8X7U0C6_BRACI|nr:hypothetical protein Bca52824_068336 [Brassica carinata]
MAVVALKCPDIEVAVVDISVPRINAWNSDQLPIYEPSLDEVIKQCPLCEATDADVTQVAYAVGTDSRIGSKFLNSSVEFGGSFSRRIF